MLKRPVVVVSAPIGGGKTTVVNALAPALRVQPLVERHDLNPFLNRFYRHRRRWALPSQLFFLLEAWVRERRARRNGGVVEGSLADVQYAYNATLAKSRTLGPLSACLLTLLFRALSGRGLKPDVVLLLRAPTPVLLDRIRKRGRASEVNITAEYLDQLAQGPSRYWVEEAGERCLLVDTTKVDAREAAGRDALVRRCRDALSRDW